MFHVKGTNSPLGRFPLTVQRAAPFKGAKQVTFIHKSDIVAKAVSLQKQESVAMPENSAPPKGAKTMSSEQSNALDDPVGAALRRLHDDVVAEPLPEEFLRLLGEIESKISAQTGEE